MKRPAAPRSLPLSALLALSLVTLPLASRAQAPDPAGDPQAGGSKYGALMAIACGASLNIARHAPAAPVIAVAVATCLAALLDAIGTPD